MSTPIDNFVINKNGSVTDIESGLTWMRCALGQEWSGTSCIGKAKTFTWYQSKQTVKQINQARAADHQWRMPKLNELATIVERQCKSPRINLKVFPNTNKGSYWSQDGVAGKAHKAYAMNFDRQGVKVFLRVEPLLLRLVSGRE